MTKPARVKQLDLHTSQGDAGSLLRESQFVVRYKDDALKRTEVAISLTMPPRPDGWKSNEIPPVLAMNLPEGFLLDRVLQQFRKVMDVDDDMNLLAVTSTPTAGRVWASVPGEKNSDGRKGPIPLRDILAHRGAESLFDELLEKYSTAAISGVQPKVVVPSAGNEGPLDKSAVKSPDLIVKSAGDQYPDLAENEFICMSIAKCAGLRTPDFYLSDDRKLFVIKRFDMGDGGYLGFEDLAALTGRHPKRKYDGSYADVAKAVSLNVAAANRTAALERLFRLIVFSCIIRNGDAHLKNFGVLYGDPSTADRDADLAPAYDLICSTVYLPKDTLALTMGGSKAWPQKDTIERFGRVSCDIESPGRIIDDVIERSMHYQYADAESPMWKQIRHEMDVGVTAIQAQRASRRGKHLMSS